jgi:two-component system response regulator YesN
MTEILVVDDEPLVLLTIRSLCDWGRHGIHIAGECGNGKDALEFLSARPGIDIVLTDVDMPVMDGLELAEGMRACGHGADVIFLSSYSNFDYVRRAFKSGALDYILKTELDEDRILALLAKTIERRAADSAISAGGQGPGLGALSDSDAATHLPQEAVQAVQEGFFRGIIDGSVTDPGAAFDAAAFSVTCPFYFMIVRPGDLPLVRQRYENSLFDFQRTVTDLLSHYARPSGGDSGAISFDQYYVLMEDSDAMEKAFDLFYEAAWSYMDVGFERKVGAKIERADDLAPAFASCLRGFVAPSRIVIRTRRYVREHFGNPALGLAEIAEYSEVSKNHLSWEFARETGENVSDFIARTRIQEAKKFLLETNLKTYEIAERTGYANAETFCRAFKKLTGTSPRRYS